MDSIPTETNSVSQKKLRVLIVAPSLDILGGQSIQAACLLNRLANERQLEMGFLPVNPKLPGWLGKLQRMPYVRTILTSLAYISKLLVTIPRFDLIHIYSASYFSFLLAPTPAILIGKLFRRKLLLNYHSGEAEDHFQNWKNTALPTIKLVDEIVVPSEYLVRVFARFNLKAKAIYNLVDSEKFRFRHRQPLRPVFISNRSFEWHYGVDRVLNAFSIIQDRIPEAHLIIAGDGPDRAALEELALHLQLRTTEFVGRVSQERIAELYDQADVFLNGSTVDNQPLSILEAFNCGLPVVTTNPGAIPDMVINEQTGLLVETTDYRDLAHCALRLLEDQSLAGLIIEGAKKEAQKYSWNRVREEWVNCYRDICSRNKTSPVLQRT